MRQPVRWTLRAACQSKTTPPVGTRVKTLTPNPVPWIPAHGQPFDVSNVDAGLDSSVSSWAPSPDPIPPVFDLLCTPYQRADNMPCCLSMDQDAGNSFAPSECPILAPKQCRTQDTVFHLPPCTSKLAISKVVGSRRTAATAPVDLPPASQRCILYNHCLYGCD